MRPSVLARCVRLGVLSIGAVAMLFPYLWMVSTSLKPQDDVFSSGLSLWPRHWAVVENYAKAFHQVPMGRILLNGVLVCAAILFFQIVFALPAAYALAKLRFRGRSLLFGLVVLGLLVPIQAISLPMYAAARALGLMNTLTVMTLPFLLSVFAIFQFRQVIKAMPDDIIHAGRMDGLSELAIVWRILLPNMRQAATAFAIFSVVSHWNDLYWPSVVITHMDKATPPLGLLFFRAAEVGDDYGALMAATVIVTLPLVVLFLLAQKAFIEGITMTGMKG
jgi:multiple sugar transport system permease protein